MKSPSLSMLVFVLVLGSHRSLQAGCLETLVNWTSNMGRRAFLKNLAMPLIGPSLPSSPEKSSIITASTSDEVLLSGEQKKMLDSLADFAVEYFTKFPIEKYWRDFRQGAGLPNHVALCTPAIHKLFPPAYDLLDEWAHLHRRWSLQSEIGVISRTSAFSLERISFLGVSYMKDWARYCESKTFEYSPEKVQGGGPALWFFWPEIEKILLQKGQSREWLAEAKLFFESQHSQKHILVTSEMAKVYEYYRGISLEDLNRAVSFLQRKTSKPEERRASPGHALARYPIGPGGLEELLDRTSDQRIILSFVDLTGKVTQVFTLRYPLTSDPFYLTSTIRRRTTASWFSQKIGFLIQEFPEHEVRATVINDNGKAFAAKLSGSNYFVPTRPDLTLMSESRNASPATLDNCSPSPPF